MQNDIIGGVAVKIGHISNFNQSNNFNQSDSNVLLDN